MEFFHKKIKQQYKAAFLGTVITGLICYFYTMSHHFLTYDSLWNLHFDQDMISSGRQFLTYACGISSYYDLPALNGILAIFYLAVTAIVLTDLLEIREAATAALLGGLLVSFPSVASTFCYSYTVDGYMLAVLCTTLALWLTEKYKWGFAGGILLAGFAIGVYQAYYSYLIVLCIIKLLLDLPDAKKIKDLFPRIGRYLAMGAGSYLFYVVTLKIMLAVKHVEASGYQGTDKVLSFSLGGLPSGLFAALQNAVDFARWGHVFTITSSMKLAYFILLLLCCCLYGICFAKKGRHKQSGHVLLAILLIAALPFALNIITVLAPDSYFHLLMRYPWVLLFVFVLVLPERIGLLSMRKKVCTALTLATLFCTAVMVFEFAVTANIVAFNMEERYEKTYALCVRIADRLEQTNGYETGMPVAILGGTVDQEYYPSTSLTDGDLSGFFGSNGDYCVNSTEKFASFFAHYLNFTIETVSFDREDELIATPEFQEMPKFPDAECIREIQGVWVIKING